MDQGYTWVQDNDGMRRRLTAEELRGDREISEGTRFITAPINSQSGGDNSRVEGGVEGEKFLPSIGTFWKNKSSEN